MIYALICLFKSYLRRTEMNLVTTRYGKIRDNIDPGPFPCIVRATTRRRDSAYISHVRCLITYVWDDYETALISHVFYFPRRFGFDSDKSALFIDPVHIPMTVL